MGIERGQVIGIVEATAPETTIALLGALTLGVKVADLGDGCDSEELLELMARAQCSAVVCGAREQADILAAAVRQQCGERRLIGWGAASSVGGVLPFSQVCLKGAELLEWEPMRASRMIALVEDGDDAIILPRSRRRSQSISPTQLLVEKCDRYGVHLTHANVFAAAESFRKVLSIGQNDKIFRLGEGMGLVELGLVGITALLSGAAILFDTGELSRQQRIEAMHPTVLLADADELDALYRDMDRELLVGAAWRRWLANWARRVGNEAARRRVSGFENGVLLNCSLFIADQAVLAEYRRMLGGMVRRLVSRGGRTRRSTRWFFEAIGLSPLGIVGVPESLGIGLLESPEDPRPGSFGKAMPNVGVCVDDAGRVLISGPFIARDAFEREPSGWMSLGISAEIDVDGTVWPERALGALDAPSLAVLPIAEHLDPVK
jgi:long-subunit acyl-CoA synthetase (AMP-forming)